MQVKKERLTTNIQTDRQAERHIQIQVIADRQTDKYR
jgi:hypothetical protein